MKSARGAAGARAAGSHTGALVSGSDATVDALFRQAGVIRATTMSELFDVTTLLSRQPLPEGGRVAILTNAGGPGILCADACEEHGLEVVELPPDLRERLRRHAAPEASVGNPVNLLAAATPDQFGRALGELLAHEGDRRRDRRSTSSRASAAWEVRWRPRCAPSPRARGAASR